MASTCSALTPFQKVSDPVLEFVFSEDFPAADLDHYVVLDEPIGGVWVVRVPDFVPECNDSLR